MASPSSVAAERRVPDTESEEQTEAERLQAQFQALGQQERYPRRARRDDEDEEDRGERGSGGAGPPPEWDGWRTTRSAPSCGWPRLRSNHG